MVVSFSRWGHHSGSRNLSEGNGARVANRVTLAKKMDTAVPRAPRAAEGAYIVGRKAAARVATMEYDRVEITRAMLACDGVARRAHALLGIASHRFYGYALRAGVDLQALRSKALRDRAARLVQAAPSEST